MKRAKFSVFLVGMVLIFSLLLTPVTAESRDVVYFLSWGGTIQQTFEELGMAERFYEETGFRVVLVPKATTSEIIAQAMVQRDNPQVDVIMCDVGPLASVADQLLIDLDETMIPNFRYIMDEGIRSNHVFVSTSTGILVYNPEWFEANNISPPNSWADFLRPELAGKMLIQNISNTYGLMVLVELARLGGGGESNIEPGFEKLAQIAPGVVDWPTTIVRYEQAFLSGEVVFASQSWVDSTRMRNKGIPIERVMPKEGAFINGSAAGIMRNAPNPEGAKAFLNFLLSEGYQKMQADTFARGSFNTRMVPDPDRAADLLSVEMMLQLRPFDWETVTPLRREWQARFNRIVER